MIETNFIEEELMNIVEKIQQKIDSKTKPLGALGQLEKIALQIATLQNTLSPHLSNPHIVVFSADHGITSEGVSLYPSEVTAQMVLNFVAGGAAINVFARQNGIGLTVVDAGVNYDFDLNLPILHQKIAHGTRNFRHEKAMTEAQMHKAIAAGKKVVQDLYDKKCNVIGLGEMGIGNTSSAALLMHCLTDVPITDCVGRGTGLNDDQLNQKIDILQKCLDKHPEIDKNDPYEVLCTFGGFEIAQMVGAFLKAQSLGIVILIDGFIASAAFLVAQRIESRLLKNAIFCHQSDEKGHRLLLDFLNANPILKLNLRLGEGTGVALAYPMIQAAVNFFNEMATFESASISESIG